MPRYEAERKRLFALLRGEALDDGKKRNAKSQECSRILPIARKGYVIRSSLKATSIVIVFSCLCSLLLELLRKKDDRHKFVIVRR